MRTQLLGVSGSLLRILEVGRQGESRVGPPNSSPRDSCVAFLSEFGLRQAGLVKKRLPSATGSFSFFPQMATSSPPLCLVHGTGTHPATQVSSCLSLTPAPDEGPRPVQFTSAGSLVLSPWQLPLPGPGLPHLFTTTPSLESVLTISPPSLSFSLSLGSPPNACPLPEPLMAFCALQSKFQLPLSDRCRPPNQTPSCLSTPSLLPCPHEPDLGPH